MTALAALNRARQAWEKTQPQLIFDFEYDRALGGAVLVSDPPRSRPGTVPPSARALAAGSRKQERVPVPSGKSSAPCREHSVLTSGAEPHCDPPRADGDFSPVTVPPVRSSLGGSAPSCHYHDERQATHKVTWTTYGGGLVTKRICDQCAARVRGQRGVRLLPLHTREGGAEDPSVQRATLQEGA